MVVKYCIIGASAAGINAASEIRKNDSSGEIIVFSEENRLPYYRPYLSHYVGDESVMEKSNFHIKPESWYKENKIELRKDEKVEKIHTGEKILFTGKDSYSCDKIIFATGSKPFVPVPGILEKTNVFSMRTMDDSVEIRKKAKKSSRVAVIGGGLLGLELADSLLSLNCHTTIIEMADRILPRQLDASCSSMFSEAVESKGAKIMFGTKATDFNGNEKIDSLTFSSGETLNFDMIVFSIGVRPEVTLAEESGLEVARAIVVNEKMETSVPDIYACGDCAQFGREPLLWLPAVKQGRTAGANAAGMESIYKTSEYPAILSSFGTKIFSAGDICDPSDEDVSVKKKSEKEKMAVLFFKNKKLSGGVLMNNMALSQKLLKGIKEGFSIEKASAELLY
ncbi:MAG: FAD-dependent oxidoreductase [bacterium]